jgi:hypothetical protein
MNEQQGQYAEEDERKRSLHIYLRDHTAGAEHAIQLFKVLKDHHAGTSLGQFAADQLQQVEEDLRLLENLAQRTGADRFQVKEVAGWLAEKLSRLKLAPIGSPLNTFETLEFLSLGILGKRALWRALMSIASVHPELQGTDFVSLLERAETQYAATEKMRLQIAVHVFVSS